jgi:hypothetical protein
MDQQTTEWVKRDFSIPAQIPEMDFSEYKTKKLVEMDFSKYKTMRRVEMDFYMTTQEPVQQVYSTDMVLMAVLMMLQMATILCPTLTSCRSLHACTGVRSHPSDKEVAPPASRETVMHT